MTLDLELFHLLNSFAGQAVWLDALIVFFGRYLPYLVIAILFVFALMQKGGREKIHFFCVPLVSAFFAKVAVVDTFRLFIHRPRPFTAFPEIFHLLTESSPSFPSGHSIFFFTLSTAVFAYNKRLGMWFFIASALVGIARVVAGVHYPSDIAGGAVIGILVGWFGIFLAKRFGFLSQSSLS